MVCFNKNVITHGHLGVLQFFRLLTSVSLRSDLYFDVIRLRSLVKPPLAPSVACGHNKAADSNSKNEKA